MLRATASAPGKLILCGEHSVVYSPHPAIASSLSSLRVSVTSTFIPLSIFPFSLPPSSPSPSTSTSLVIVVEDSPSTSITLPNFTSATISQASEFVATSSPTSPPILLQTAPPILTLCLSIPSIASLPPGVLTIQLKSLGLPIGAGLGSSAALSTAVAASLLALTDSNYGALSNYLSEEQLSEINRLSYLSESVFHGTPSGIDNTVSTYGGSVRLVRTAEGSTMFKRLKCVNPSQVLSIVICDTKVPKSTKKLVAGVRELKSRLPAVVEGVFSAIDGIVESFESVLGLVEIDGIIVDNDHINDYTLLNELITLNQNLLTTLNVSHPVINQVNELTTSQFQLPTKLTGAGGGGCCFTIIDPSKDIHSSKVVDAILNSSISNQQSSPMNVFSSILGGEGVKIVQN